MNPALAVGFQRATSSRWGGQSRLRNQRLRSALRAWYSAVEAGDPGLVQLVLAEVTSELASFGEEVLTWACSTGARVW